MRRVGRYEVVTLPNNAAAVPDVIVHAAADSKSTSVGCRPTGNDVRVDDVTPALAAVQSPDGAVRRPPTSAVAVDGGTLSLSVGAGSSSLPQLSPVSGRQQAALDETGSNKEPYEPPTPRHRVEATLDLSKESFGLCRFRHAADVIGAPHIHRVTERRFVCGCTYLLDRSS